MVISIADNEKLYTQIGSESLPDGWRNIAAYPELRNRGSKWYYSKVSLVLSVPSAVIIHEHNYLVHTRHPEFAKHVQLVRTEEFFWDERLGKGTLKNR